MDLSVLRFSPLTFNAVLAIVGVYLGYEVYKLAAQLWRGKFEYNGFYGMLECEERRKAKSVVCSCVVLVR
jgi:hypothetical protein